MMRAAAVCKVDKYDKSVPADSYDQLQVVVVMSTWYSNCNNWASSNSVPLCQSGVYQIYIY